MNLLEIEWRHLDRDGKTCDRCADTGETVREACEALAGELGPAGWEVRLRETLLTDREIPESNMILLNGTPIEELLPDARAAESCCASCGDLLGVPVLCRTLEQDGRTFEAIPAAMIREAARRLIERYGEYRRFDMEIKILGPGCQRCKDTEDIVREAVAETGVDARIEKITDPMKIAGYGVFGTPAVVIDGEVKSVGKVPGRDEVKGWLKP